MGGGPAAHQHHAGRILGHQAQQVGGEQLVGDHDAAVQAAIAGAVAEQIAHQAAGDVLQVLHLLAQAQHRAAREQFDMVAVGLADDRHRRASGADPALDPVHQVLVAQDREMGAEDLRHRLLNPAVDAQLEALQLIMGQVDRTVQFGEREQALAARSGIDLRAHAAQRPECDAIGGGDAGDGCRSRRFAVVGCWHGRPLSSMSPGCATARGRIRLST